VNKLPITPKNGINVLPKTLLNQPTIGFTKAMHIRFRQRMHLILTIKTQEKQIILINTLNILTCKPDFIINKHRTKPLLSQLMSPNPSIMPTPPKSLINGVINMRGLINGHGFGGMAGNLAPLQVTRQYKLP
jgi:hypothetical protein